MTSPDPRPRVRSGWLRAVVALGVVAVVGVVAACGGGDPPASSLGVSALGPSAPIASAGVATPSPTPTGVPSGSSAVGSATGSPGLPPIVVDAGLLAILPASVDGIAVQAAPETAAQMIGDPQLARSASAVAIGIVVASGSSTGDDIASAGVIQLRPGIFDPDFYATWRAGYDEAACVQAGGIASHAQEQIGVHAVEVTVCSGGARTYHTHLAGDILVSITAVGERRFGERVMAGLRR